MVDSNGMKNIVSFYQSGKTYKITSCQVGKRIDCFLAIDILRNAVRRRGVSKKVMFYTDWRSQFTSSNFRKEINSLHMVQSFAPFGCSASRGSPEYGDKAAETSARCVTRCSKRYEKTACRPDGLDGKTAADDLTGKRIFERLRIGD